MMRVSRIGALFLVLGLFGRIAAVAEGQSPALYLEYGATFARLQTNVQVRDELRLTDDQLATIKEIGNEFLAKYARPANESSGNLTEEQREQKRGELKKLGEEAARKAKAVLTAEQAARFKQIEIWMNGPMAFIDPNVVRELELTEQQKGTLKTITDEFLNEDGAVMEERRRNRRISPKDEQVKREQAKFDQETNAKREKVFATKLAECLAALTDDQKGRFEKLRGAKLEIRPQSRGK